MDFNTVLTHLNFYLYLLIGFHTIVFEDEPSKTSFIVVWFVLMINLLPGYLKVIGAS